MMMMVVVLMMTILLPESECWNEWSHSVLSFAFASNMMFSLYFSGQSVFARERERERGSECDEV